ncbi:MAG TPA: hypothetical protein VFL61_01590 [Gaiellaceae bacterium]|nr:hypothetical protein [Gaiellaceae bacterium]
MSDLFIIFVPQWSPFQPALSLPSLSAWLKRGGFDVRSLDANVLFYEWLFSDECADKLTRRVQQSTRSRAERSAYETLFSSVSAFRDDLNSLREPLRALESPEGYTARSYLAVQSFETYLAAISEVADDFRHFAVRVPVSLEKRGGESARRTLERSARPPRHVCACDD